MDLQQLLNAAGPAGPTNLFKSIDNSLGGPADLDEQALTALAAYYEEDRYDQAVTHATQLSGTDLLAATPIQKYVDDTRTTLWASNQNQIGLTSSNTITAMLVSAQCVNLATTRIHGVARLESTAACQLTTPNLFFVDTINITLKAGTNGMQIVGGGGGADESVKTHMGTFRSNFTKSGKCVTTNTSVDNISKGVYTYPVLAMAAATPKEIRFSYRPFSSLFQSPKMWPPNVPLQMQLQWNTENADILNMFTPSVATNLSYMISIEYITSEEIYLSSPLRNRVLSHFEISPTTNINSLHMTRRRVGDEAEEIVDNTFGMKDYDPSRVAAIYQFKDSRITTFTVSGTQFDVMPVLNGSARPSMIIISLTPGTNALLTANIAQLKTLQVYYDGRAVWHKPMDKFELYCASKKALLADRAYQANVWFPDYDTWLASPNPYIVLRVGQSHNENEINPTRSTQLSLVGTTENVNNMKVYVTLFFDQTLCIFKNSEAALALPIN